MTRLPLVRKIILFRKKKNNGLKKMMGKTEIKIN
jgi:hypothetical protein